MSVKSNVSSFFKKLLLIIIKKILIYFPFAWFINFASSEIVVPVNGKHVRGNRYGRGFALRCIHIW